MVDDVVARLRKDRPLSWEDRFEAAEEITRLREENARLREALDPFVRRLKVIEEMKNHKYACATTIAVDHLRAARICRNGRKVSLDALSPDWAGTDGDNMKIEAGKHYELRNGDTAYIYEVDIGEHGNIAGKVTNVKGDAQVTTWTEKGLWSITSGLSTSPLDIIRAVSENRVVYHYNTYSNGFTSNRYATQAEADKSHMKGDARGWLKIVWEDNKIVSVDWSNA